ncbi:MAG TPA: hypothetical protein VGD65_03360 [Chryseosolibacter sp.]
MKTLTIALLALLSELSMAQERNFTRLFQLSLAPALSTNGMNSEGFNNYISFNLTSGVSSETYLLEIGTFSNLNVLGTRGLQVAGIANVTGGNAFARMLPKEIDRRKREGFEANLSGAQFSGVVNLVLNNVFGWQATGGVNIAKGALHGFQLSGISNTVYRWTFGVQLAGLYNVSRESMDGVQVAGLFNVTEGGLYGAQLSLVNRAGFMNGINSFDSDDPTGVQIGLVNLAKAMDGYQFGLINIAGPMKGTQIGLINIGGNGRDPQTRNGTAIGLINIGSAGYFAAYTSDLFPVNLEIASGTMKNARIVSDRFGKFVQNGLIFSNAGWLTQRENWALGYGLKKFYFNRTLTPGYNHFRFIAFGTDIFHVNHVRQKITKELSMLARPVVMAGSRFTPKNKRYFFFASVAYNLYKSKSGKTIDAALEKTSQSAITHWPGFAGGVLIQ